MLSRKATAKIPQRIFSNVHRRVLLYPWVLGGTFDETHHLVGLGRDGTGLGCGLSFIRLQERQLHVSSFGGFGLLLRSLQGFVRDLQLPQISLGSTTSRGARST